MAVFRIQIAGAVGEVHSLFDSTRDYCRKYLTEAAADFSVTVTREHLTFEQAELLEEARREGMRPRTFTDPFLERQAIQRAFAEYLLSRNTLLFHGSAVAVDGEGYLFTAACGTGKSTHTRLWRQVFGSRAVMVNDDKPFLKITESGVAMYGAPWSGKHGLDANIAVPLKGICILTRGGENRIWRLSPQEAHTMLLQQCFLPSENLVAALEGRIPLWKMECTKDPEAAVVSHRAMSQ